MMAAISAGTERIYRSLAFRAKRKAAYAAWWLRWGWRPYGRYHRFAMDRLAERDPRRAVGGMWDVLGPLQLEFLKSQGLRPEHTLLDIGCGSLRGGRHLIKYLNPGNYWGVEISPVLLNVSHQLVEDERLSERRPHLCLTEGFDFGALKGAEFDFVHAFGVFTDVPVNYVKECFGNLGTVLAPGAEFLATYVPGRRYIADPVGIGFQYPLTLLQQIGRSNGYVVEEVPDFHHPRGHHMLVARPESAGFPLPNEKLAGAEGWPLRTGWRSMSRDSETLNKKPNS